MKSSSLFALLPPVPPPLLLLLLPLLLPPLLLLLLPPLLPLPLAVDSRVDSLVVVSLEAGGTI